MQCCTPWWQENLSALGTSSDVSGAAMYFPVGYYNLTAVELIAASLVFAWLIVLIRNLAAVDADQLAANPPAHPQLQRTETAGHRAAPGTDRTATES